MPTPRNPPNTVNTEETELPEVVHPTGRKSQPKSLHESLNLLKGSSKEAKKFKSRIKALEATIPKPEVWARIRPPPNFEDNILKVEELGKQIGVKLDDPYKIKETYVYPTDGILYNTSQEETFQLVANDLVEKALNGTSVLFLTLGSAQSGKQFTLFGNPGKYDHRGLIPRTVDKICNKMEVTTNDVLYQLFISGIQISQNHIKDLITMTPYNIDCIGNNGPCQMLLHEVYNRDEAGAIIHRIFSGIKAEKNEMKSKNFHMFIYFDICAVKLHEKAPVQRSRITFAKVASIPKRQNLHRNFAVARGPCVDFQSCSCDPAVVRYSIRSLAKFQGKDMTFPYYPIKCCRHKLNSKLEDSAEASEIRRDLFFLEQLFVRANTMRKLNALKVKRPELVTKYMRKLQVTPSQFVRQCKLTHCLKDMCKVNTEVRVLIHVRPEIAYIDNTIDTLKFAERVKGIPCDSEFVKSRRQGKNPKMMDQKLVSVASLYSNSQKPEVEESFVSNILAEAEKTGDDVTVGLNPYQVRMLHQQLNQYFKEKLELTEVKAKPVKKRKIAVKIVMPPSLVPSSAKGVKQLRASTSNSEINKIPTPPPSAVEEMKHVKPGDLISHAHPHLAMEFNENEKKGENTGEKETIKMVEGEKSTAVIFKKEEDKHSSKKGKKQVLQTKVEKSKKSERKSSQNSSDKKLPSSAKENKANRKKSRAALPTPPNSAPVDAKEKRKHHEKDVPPIQDVVEEDAPPTCLEVWNSFLQSRIGARSFMEFRKNLESFSKFNFEQQNLKKYSINLVQKINPLQAQLEDYKSTRFLKYKKKPELMKTIPISKSEKEIRYNIKVLQLSRDPLLVRLRNMNRQYGSHETGFENARKSCENAFHLFSLHHFGVMFPAQEIPINIPGLPLEMTNKTPTTSPVKEAPVSHEDGHKSLKTKADKRIKGKNLAPTMFAMRRRTKSFPEELVDSIHSKNYKNVSRVGKVQAAILRKLNHFRPAWIKYC